MDLPGGEPVGGPHPHAGFETLTLELQGDGQHFETGSFELMTAGKGIVHTKEIRERTHMHIIQVWMALPPDQRHRPPRWQKLGPKSVPTREEKGYRFQLYGGTSSGIQSPIEQATPFTLAQIHMNPDQIQAPDIPAEQNGFLYLLEGEVRVGETHLSAGQLGWLSPEPVEEATWVPLHSGPRGSHILLLTARPHAHPVLVHGPFVADHSDEFQDLYRSFRRGEIPHLEDLPSSARLVY